MTFQIPADDLERRIVERLVDAALRFCTVVEDREDSEHNGWFEITDADVCDLRRHVEDARSMGLLR